MTSRLDRLFVLLETGSSGVTRRAAATQLGEVQRLHPHELHTLLSRITKLLRSGAWDTRIAASHAVTAVLDNVPLWNPPGVDKPDGNAESISVAGAGRLNYASFQLDKVLTECAYLMGSEGKEYDTEDDPPVGAEQMQNQLMQEMGVPMKLESAGITSEDLRANHTFSPVTAHKISVLEVVSEELSSRERNRARRKARQASTRQDYEEGEQPQPAKRIKLEEGGVEDTWANEPTPDNTGAWASDAVDWPLEGFYEMLCREVFSVRWETRHGAATALRELVRIHGRGAGKSTDIPAHLMEEHHQLYLEDLSLRLLCVLALDRFGDFVSDQVVAPVRETCAQTLGSVVNLMSKERVEKVVELLVQLLSHADWEARHGGLLGLKYLLAVRQDMSVELLKKTLPVIQTGLRDSVDDVGAVAASALIPASHTIVFDFPDHVSPIVTAVWDLLADQDELAAACNSFMGLLAAILSLPESARLVSVDQGVVARLWPFLSHGTSSVRRATLQTLTTLTVQSERVQTWSPELLTEALRHLFQRALVEPVLETQLLVEKVWNNLVTNSQLSSLLIAVCPYVSCWLCMSMQPAKLHFEPCVLVQCRSELKGRKVSLEGEQVSSELKLYLGGSETTPPAVREQNVTQCRCMAARMLGLLSCYIVKPSPDVVYTPEIEPPIDCYVKVLLVYLNSKSAVQRLVTGLVVGEWGRLSSPSPLPTPLTSRLHTCLTEAVYYDEIALSFTRLLQETRDFIATLKHYKLPFDSNQYGKVLTLEQIQQLAGPVTSQLLTSHKLKPKVLESLEERRRAIQGSVSQTASDQQFLTVSTQAALVGAVLMLNFLPEKLSHIIKPLMDSIKREKTEILQNLSAQHLAHLVDKCVNRSPCPNNKIITNLCLLLRSDPEFTPRILEPDSNSGSSDSGVESLSSSRTNTPTPSTTGDKYSGILTLLNQQKNAERAVFKRANSTGGRGPGRPPTTDIPLEELFAADDEAIKILRVQRRGAAAALTAITSHLGPDLEQKLNKLWNIMLTHLQTTVNPSTFDLTSAITNDAAADDLVSSLQVLEVVSPALHYSILPKVVTVLDQLCTLLCHPYRAVRHLAARCIATLSVLDTHSVLEVVVCRVVPHLTAADNVVKRQGAVECLACVAEKLQLKIVPYIVLLIVPLLGRMSDQDTAVRLMSTHTFAALIQLMPLDGGVQLPPSLARQRDKDKQFLEQLFHPRTIPDYKVPVPIRAILRSYQQAGVNWLAFLNRYKLHGILCDDMGLGKTLQSICIVAGDYYTHSQQFQDSTNTDTTPLPSLVVCPPTLTGHWVYEVDKFLSPEYLNPLHYAGPPAEREKLRCKVGQHNLVVASYDIIRKDIEFFSSIQWNYCILDEGHVIKNGKTKSSKAIKQLKAIHRLILSGTPIQNNVLELWSLFDFLMPGFLGTERQFTAKYSRPILASRDPKSSPQEQEAGVLAMEALHKQVLPFVLRRMKEDVLKDLPPKITQDYYCDLSPLQERLYEDFSRSRSLADIGTTQVNTHIFQALRYLQNVCNHPKLVLTPTHPEFSRIFNELRTNKTSLNDIDHGCKLPALKQLLLDCGIGQTAADNTTGSVVSPHRALIFCQIKAMLDIVENDLLKAHMPSVTYLRLDGSVPPSSRHSVVARFNSDPSIDVLLLTTQVGGLGLNLTGADTVIFVEHDWSPMRDLQAMDRAHRIGQKRVVNVYRLITRGTLEEKIMGLQKFKLLTANTVISGENASLETMATDKLLDLFSLEGNTAAPRASGSAANLTMKAILDNLPELWEEKCYEEEYDLTNFVRNLRQ